MIKHVVFDIGNVLTDFRWAAVLDELKFTPEVRAVLEREIFLSPLWNEFDRGVMGDEAVFAAMRKNCGGLDAEFRTVFDHFQQMVTERAYSEPLIRDLKARGFGVYILSNYGDTMYHCNAVRFRFLKAVDGAVFSYREKIIKPDPAIYHTLLSRYGLNAKECVFIDDRQENVDGARAVGMDSFRADSEQTIRAGLAERGIL